MNALEMLLKRNSVQPKITLEKIAITSGVPKTTIHAIESGRVQNPGIQTFFKIQTALETLIAERQGQKSPSVDPQTPIPGDPPIDPTTT